MSMNVLLIEAYYVICDSNDIFIKRCVYIFKLARHFTEIIRDVRAIVVDQNYIILKNHGAIMEILNIEFRILLSDIYHKNPLCMLCMNDMPQC